MQVEAKKETEYKMCHSTLKAALFNSPLTFTHRSTVPINSITFISPADNNTFKFVTTIYKALCINLVFSVQMYSLEKRQNSLN